MTSTDQRPSLGSFWHDLPREGKLLLSNVVFQFIGTGLVLPFHVVYLHEVRDFPLADVGLLLGISPLVGFLAVGPGGAAIDRIGARRVMVICLSLFVLGDVAMALAATEVVAALALVLSGGAFGLAWPTVQSMVSVIVPSHLRQRYFGIQFALLNLGIGIGGIIGGLYVDVDRLVTFQTIYLGDAVSYLPALALLVGPLRHVAGRPVRDESDGEATVGYLAIIRSRAVGSLLVLSFVSSFVGYSQLNAGFPAFARAVGEVSTRAIGFAFAANTLVIVVLQLFVLRRIEGVRRTRVIAVMGVVWATAWLVLGASGLVSGTLGAAVLVAACASMFALGETMLQPTIPALMNDLAPDHLRGRYNAASAAAFQLAAIVAPPAAGLLIGHQLAAAHIAVIAVGSLAVGIVAVARVEPLLTPEENGVR